MAKLGSDRVIPYRLPSIQGGTTGGAGTGGGITQPSGSVGIIANAENLPAYNVVTAPMDIDRAVPYEFTVGNYLYINYVGVPINIDYTNVHNMDNVASIDLEIVYNNSITNDPFSTTRPQVKTRYVNATGTVVDNTSYVTLPATDYVSSDVTIKFKLPKTSGTVKIPILYGTSGNDLQWVSVFTPGSNNLSLKVTPDIVTYTLQMYDIAGNVIFRQVA